jgi:hypothetical protein
MLILPYFNIWFLPLTYLIAGCETGLKSYSLLIEIHSFTHTASHTGTRKPRSLTDDHRRILPLFPHQHHHYSYHHRPYFLHDRPRPPHSFSCVESHRRHQ